ncbi:HNH endonuclease [Inquilinus sp.]|uniref:HNH endonuclease n=1 Tax=Inquilinus sp. TaxID=1932117 RepID=UPI0031D619AA
MTRALPLDRREFAKLWPKFREWLEQHGSDILAPTNPYEVARFTTPVGKGVVYADGAGRITSWAGGADAALLAHRAGDNDWRAVPKTARRRSGGVGRKRPVFLALAARDGSACVYCGEPLTLETATIEHIVPLAAGGPDTVINKALSCEPCNQEGGARSPVEKLRRIRR